MEPKSILAVDCGSTTTKAVLITRQRGRYALAGWANAPTTVEAPYDDVILGLRQAVRLLESETGRALLESHVVSLGELVYLSAAKSCYGQDNRRLPVVFAGNREARQHVRDILGGISELAVVDNLRPVITGDGEPWQLAAQAVSPTTNHGSVNDLAIGALDAISALEQQTGRRPVDGGSLIMSVQGDAGAWSSRGGAGWLLISHGRYWSPDRLSSCRGWAGLRPYFSAF